MVIVDVAVSPSAQAVAVITAGVSTATVGAAQLLFQHGAGMVHLSDFASIGP